MPYSYTVTETITFRECDARPLDDLRNQRMSVERAYVVYGGQEQIVRYATTNRIGITASEFESFAICQQRCTHVVCACALKLTSAR